MVKVVFFGLGVMGYLMVGYLVKVGYEVIVYNCIIFKVESWVVEYGGVFGKILCEVVFGVEIVFVCVGNDDDLRFVCMGLDGVFQLMEKGVIFVDYIIVLVKVICEFY